MKKIFFAVSLIITASSLSHAQADYEIQLLKNISIANNISSSPNNYFIYNNQLTFNAGDGIHGAEIWKTDGTAIGTDLLIDAIPGSQGVNYNQPILFNGKIYFSGYSVNEGNELWVTDGTAAGTHIVKDIRPGTTSSNIRAMVVYNNKLYFSANDGVHGFELWESDGTETGTQLFMDIKAGDQNSHSNISNMIVFNNKLFFNASTYLNATELWSSDGTVAGTQLFHDLTGDAYTGSHPSNFIVVNDELFFTALLSTTGVELWATDGTSSGTRMVKDIFIGTGNGSPKNMVEFNNKLYFQATDNGISDPYWWSSDGTESGTTVVPVTNPHNVTNILNPVVFNNKIYFKASTSNYGFQLGYLDENNVIQLKLTPVVYNDALNQGLSNMIVYNDELFFSSKYNDQIGTEVYKLTKIKPTLTSNASNASICTYDTLTFTATKAVEYEFLVNGVVAQSRSTDTTFTLSGLTAATQVKLNGYDANGTFIGSDSLSFNVTQIDATITENENELTAISGYDAYLWKGCTPTVNPTANHLTNIFTAPTSGSYAVEITHNGCIKLSDCKAITVTVIDTTTGVSVNLINQTSLKIYPNPSTGTIHVEFDEIKSATSIQLSDITGKIIFEKSYEQFEKAELDLTETAGTYFITVRTGMNSVTKKIQIH